MSDDELTEILTSRIELEKYSSFPWPQGDLTKLAVFFEGCEGSSFISVHFHGSDSFDSEEEYILQASLLDGIYSNSRVIDKHGNEFSVSVDVPSGKFTFIKSTDHLTKDTDEGNLIDIHYSGFRGNKPPHKKTREKQIPYYQKFSGAFNSRR